MGTRCAILGVYGQCVAQFHNSAMPHAAFHGQTPDEIYFSTGDAILEQIAEGKRLAREDRIIKNRSRSCDICPRSSGVAHQIGEPSTAKT